VQSQQIVPPGIRLLSSGLEAIVSATMHSKGKSWDSLPSPSFREFAETRRSVAFSESVVSTTYEWRRHCINGDEVWVEHKEDMLRIQRSAQDSSVVFSLIGRIELDNIAELKDILGLEPKKSLLVLDLKEITLVDRDAVRFLGSCEAEKMKLRNCPAYIREWITRERQNG